MSASKTPTLKPILANVTAKLAVTVDLPTPPFPEAMAIILLIPGICLPLIKFSEAPEAGFSGASTFMLTLTLAFSYTNS